MSPGPPWNSTLRTPSRHRRIYDVHLERGRNRVTVTVTAEDGMTTRAYSVSINRGVTGNRGWRAGADLDGLIAAGSTTPRGIWSNGETVWVVDSNTSKLFAYTLADGTRTRQGIRPACRQPHPAGIWSNRTTMWVADAFNNKLFAYTLEGGARTPTRTSRLWPTTLFRGHMVGRDDVWVPGFVNKRSTPTRSTAGRRTPTKHQSGQRQQWSIRHMV